MKGIICFNICLKFENIKVTVDVMFLLQKEDMFLQRRIGTIAALKNSHNEKQIKTTFVCVSKK